MNTYLTLDGDLLNLSDLSCDERAYLERCVAAYQAGMTWEEFQRLSLDQNPIIGRAGGRISNTVAVHPLYRAVRDLEDRLGILQGEITPDPGDNVHRDPFSDDWVPVSEAAERKHVTVQGVHKAIARGAIVAKPAKEGGRWRLVSVNSLAGWHPNPVRQAARRKDKATR